MICGGKYARIQIDGRRYKNLVKNTAVILAMGCEEKNGKDRGCTKYTQLSEAVVRSKVDYSLPPTVVDTFAVKHLAAAVKKLQQRCFVHIRVAKLRLEFV